MEHPPGSSEPRLIIVSDLHLSCPDPAAGTKAGAPSTEPAACAGCLEMLLRRMEAEGTRWHLIILGDFLDLVAGAEPDGMRIAVFLRGDTGPG